METDPMKTREEEKVKQVWTGNAALFFDLDYGLTYFDFRIQKNYSFVSICKKDIVSNHLVSLLANELTWNVICPSEPAIFENWTISEYKLTYCERLLRQSSLEFPL